MDNTPTPYLCQVSETVSCGACCGLYNLPDLSRPTLEQLLLKRSEDFASTARTEEAIFAFQRRNRGPHRLSRPFAQFHHCPFLGLIGEKYSRVGCLLHPASPGNDTVDYRSLSWYGEMACRSYFCPTTAKLSEVYLTVIARTIDNWYDFGLIVTEHVLLASYFAEVESRIGRRLTIHDYTANDDAGDFFRQFVRLKSIWRFRRRNAPGPCNFFFENGLYPRPDVWRATADIPHSVYEQFFRELDSGFSSPAELAAAEHLLDTLFNQTAQAILEFSNTA